MPFYFSLQRTNWLKDNHGEAPESSLCLSLNNLLCAKCCTSVATQIYFWQKKGCKYIIILKSNLNTVRIYKSDKFTTPISFSSVQSLSCVWLFATPWIAARQAFLSITISRSSLNSWPSSRWCHPAIWSSVIPFSSCPQSLPASVSFPTSQLFAWGGQSVGASALASVLPKKSQGWSPSEWTDWISLQSKGLSRVFSSTTVQKHQFFGAQLSSQSNCHIHTWPLEKP